MPSVSVVVPTYNRAALLEQTLQSILQQTVGVDEIIVVDDGSTDDTAGVCARHAERVRYIRQENTGLPALARNRGIAEARCDWIALCDSDDLWHPRKLEVQLDVARATSAEWVVTGFGLIDPDGARVPNLGFGFEREFPVFRAEPVSADQYFARWLRRLALVTAVGEVTVYVGDAFGMLFEGNVCLTSSALMRRSLIAQSGPFDPHFIRAEDTEFFHRVSVYAPLAIVMSNLMEYRVGHPSVMSARDLSPFMRFTLESIERMSTLRPTMTDRERAAYRLGRERLRLALAYERLSAMDGTAARAALRDGWRAGELRSLRASAIWVASLMPRPALRALHGFKRAARWAMRTRLGLRPVVTPAALRVREATKGPTATPDSTTDSRASSL
jgi:GT2 family glycosyltransferase